MQTLEQKKEQIEKATESFKKTLEESYLDDPDIEFWGIGVYTLTSLINGNFTRTQKGMLKIQLGIQAKEVLKKNVQGLPRKFEDWSYFPIVVFLNNEKPLEDERN